MRERFGTSALARFAGSHEGRLLAVTLAVVAGLSVATTGFLTVQNLFDLLTSYAFLGILAAGLLVVLVAGGIDISFTATASVAQYLALSLANAYGLGWTTTFALAVAAGVACGLVNAWLVDTLRVSSIIVTIATLNIFYGLLVFVTGGQYIYALPDWFSAGIFWFETVDAEGVSYGLNLQILLLVAAFALTWLLLNRTTIGRQIYALGGNRDAARRLGFSTRRLTFFVYGYMGLMAGLASLAQAQLAQSVAPTVLVGRELDVLAAVVLGGASLTGGVGSVLGTVLGLVLLAAIQSGLVIVGVSSYWSQLCVGLVILLSVSSTALTLRRRAGRVSA
ncbi:MAG: ABC transporter permease [Methylobacteriaceae bacterium]|nr:ABC transporter permease [Methylobacteriaceae bacterium]